MALTEKQKWMLGGTVLVGGLAVFLQSSRFAPFKPQKIIYPPQTPTGNNKNRIFMAVRDPSELQPLLNTKPPLLLNFVYRGEPASNKLTGALQRIVAYDLEDDGKLINLVDIESDEPANKDLLLTYQVNTVPSVVVVKKQIPRGSYVDKDLVADPEHSEVKWDELRLWVAQHAQDISNSESQTSKK
ncbi:unnamed protein product [Ambrosiozyma monospora]|uniref:Unnamed protein product n=1 Tax=Ambrosiozyma monospora TaxID=43982 RepID=A0A9W6YY58_AMBMO|nr:unnamed protein product [Ambrosiozyma monospora]